jgi:rhodanese-related sulfurtransferase
MGFRKTTNVIGGMDAWTGAQFETETEEFQKGTAG